MLKACIGQILDRSWKAKVTNIDYNTIAPFYSVGLVSFLIYIYFLDNYRP